MTSKGYWVRLILPEMPGRTLRSFSAELWDGIEREQLTYNKPGQGKGSQGAGCGSDNEPHQADKNRATAAKPSVKKENQAGNASLLVCPNQFKHCNRL